MFWIGQIFALKNVLDAKKGADIFRPTSSIGEYIAAGVTALIPGKGMGATLLLNVVAETIDATETAISGKKVSILDKTKDVVVGTVLDTVFEKISDNPRSL